MTSIAVRSSNTTWWRSAQLVGVGLTVALLAGLMAAPETATRLLWDGAIPLLPAVFLVHPGIWRNVCPLATLNSLSGEQVGMRRLGAERMQVAWGLGILLLAILVPARRFLYNTSGPALAITIIAVALIALGMGFVFARRAGFCNALCPVLPVEKLYGQAPLVPLRTSRCADCSLCTPVGCIDLASNKSVPQTVGRARRDANWVWTPFGIFAAAFPGFIAGYFTVSNGGLATAASVYTHVATYAAASYLIVAVVAHIWNAGTKTLLPMLGGTAFLLYYWYVAPGLADAYGASRLGPLVVRLTAALLLTLWCWRILRRRIVRTSA